MNGDIHERIRAMRVDYDRHMLLESQAPPEPLPLFEEWFEQAVSHRLPEPNAMVLSTADAHGRPACRLVLLKDFGPEGFTFFTNYESRKGRDLSGNPRACLLFFWHALQRQISIEGSVQKVDDLDSDVYFHSRVTDARISHCLLYHFYPMSILASDIDIGMANLHRIACDQHTFYHLMRVELNDLTSFE